MARPNHESRRDHSIETAARALLPYGVFDDLSVSNSNLGGRWGLK